MGGDVIPDVNSREFERFYGGDVLPDVNPESLRGFMGEM